MLLVDTSVWIEVFRYPGLDPEQAVPLDDVATCLPVVQEVLQGFVDQRAFTVAHDAMLALPMVESPLRQEVYEQAVELYRTTRRAGLAVRSGVDCLIAACAVRNGLGVLHRDRDFDAIAHIAPLEVRRVR